MKRISTLFAGLCALLLVAGCCSAPCGSCGAQRCGMGGFGGFRGFKSKRCCVPTDCGCQPGCCGTPMMGNCCGDVGYDPMMGAPMMGEPVMMGAPTTMAPQGNPNCPNGNCGAQQTTSMYEGSWTTQMPAMAVPSSTPTPITPSPAK